MPRARAARALAVSCAATAPTPAKASPATVQVSPKAIEPAGGSPATISATAVAKPMRTVPTAAVTSDAANEAKRPIEPPANSS